MPVYLCFSPPFSWTNHFLIGTLKGMQGIKYFNRYTGQVEDEMVLGEKYLQWIYGTTTGEVALHMLVKRAFFSALMGWWYNRPASAKAVSGFVNDYGINMADSSKQIGEFKHFNDFFYRKLKEGARPLAGDDDRTAVFPADARHMGWQRADEIDRVIVKGQKIEIVGRFGGEEELARPYLEGAVVLSRLCPCDYHRFHFPVSGTPGNWIKIAGPLASVSPYCLAKKLSWLWTNKRHLTFIDTVQWGRVAMLEVGATGVGLIEETYKKDTPYNRGDEKGYFAFGGSTVMCFFEPGRIKLADDLLEKTAQGMELFARQGDYMGTAP